MQKLRPDLDIGQNIRRLRMERGLTQAQVVARMQLLDVEISHSTYSKLETNRMNIRISELVALVLIFDTDFNDFFKGLIK